MTWFLGSIWLLGFLMCRFRGWGLIGNSLARVLWPLTLTYALRRTLLSLFGFKKRRLTTRRP
jgi:hypothetical protein